MFTLFSQFVFQLILGPSQLIRHDAYEPSGSAFHDTVALRNWRWRGPMYGTLQDAELCVALAFSLQYLRLTVFCWLAAMTHHMFATFRHNVNLVSHSDPHLTYSFCKYSLFGWGTPLVLIGAAVALQLNQKGPSTMTRTNCWFLDHDAFMYAFVVPVLVLLFVDFVFLARSAAVARFTINMQVDKRMRDKMRRKRRLQLCLFIKVTLLITTVATLGALSKLTTINAFWVAFNVGHGLQGIAVALCVTCNCQVLKIYTRTLRRRGRRHKKLAKYHPVTTATEVSKSTSLQMLTWDPSPDTV
ncbi:hypothetical protein C0J52_11627 [Blattella germanica]|nr:hypothetical protein C0J52_11627 [Blattella germanica]